MLTVVPAGELASLVLSAPDLGASATGAVCTGGGPTGTAADGLASGGACTSAARGGTFTLCRRRREGRRAQPRASSTRAIR